MRITQIMLSRGFGGAERAFMDTSMALADRGHTVQVICRSSFTQRGKLEVHPGIEVFGVSLLNQYDWISMLRIRAAMKRFRPAVAHIHLNRAARLGGRAAVSAGIPWVGTFKPQRCLRFPVMFNGTPLRRVPLLNRWRWSRIFRGSGRSIGFTRGLAAPFGSFRTGGSCRKRDLIFCSKRSKACWIRAWRLSLCSAATARMTIN